MPTATVHLPRSLVALFPSLPRQVEVDATDVDGALRALEARAPGLRDRLVEAGPRIREHINVFVDGEPASLHTPIGPGSVVHVIPAVSGGAESGAKGGAESGAESGAKGGAESGAGPDAERGARGDLERGADGAAMARRPRP